MRTLQASQLLRVAATACGTMLLMLVCLATGVTGSLAHNKNHHQTENTQAAQAAAIKKRQACFRTCDDKRDFCEEALVVVIVSRKYDCSKGRIECQSYCDTQAK